MGEKKLPDKSFHVSVDGVFESNLLNAYVNEGSIIEITYE